MWAQRYKKEKPAGRELLTAGVEGVDSLDDVLNTSTLSGKKKRVRTRIASGLSLSLVTEITGTQ